jgi:peroxiredoxin Q/BCP
MASTLQIGRPAPAFRALDEQGREVTLASLRGKRVILYFYPKDDTPGCTKQACAFRDQYADITAQEAVVFGVSPDPAKAHQKFIDKYTLPFPLLVDEDHAIAEAYGVWGERSMYGKTFMGIIRSQFVIDEHGILIDVTSPIKPEQSVPKALAALGKE